MKEYVVRKVSPRPEWHKGASHIKMWEKNVLGQRGQQMQRP